MTEPYPSRRWFPRCVRSVGLLLPLLVLCACSPKDQPEPPAAFRFVVMSDSQSGIRNPTNPVDYINRPVVGAIVARIGELDPAPAFVFCLGDLSWFGGAVQLADWSSVMKPLSDAGIPVYPAIGNHDITNTGGVEGDLACQQEYVRHFDGLPGNGPAGMEKLAYWFEHGRAFFAVLDAFHVEPAVPAPLYRHLEYSPAQLEWLRLQCSRTEKKVKFVFAHAPAFSVGEDDSSEYAYRHDLWSILDDAGVTMFFAGHEHLYGRWRIGPDMPDCPTGRSWNHAVTQIITGGAGGYLWPAERFPAVYAYGHPEVARYGYNFVVVDVLAESIYLRAFDPSGTLIDQVEVAAASAADAPR